MPKDLEVTNLSTKAPSAIRKSVAVVTEEMLKVVSAEELEIKLIDTDFALEMINKGEVGKLKRILKKYENLNIDSEVAIALLDTGNGNILQDQPRFNVHNPGEALARKLLESDFAFIFSRERISFKNLSKDFALYLGDLGVIDFIFLQNYKGLDNEVALKMIETRKDDDIPIFSEIYREREFFENLNPCQIGEKLIEVGRTSEFFDHFDFFKGAFEMEELANKIMDSGQTETLIIYFSLLELDSNKWAQKFIDLGYSQSLVESFGEFSGLRVEIFRQLVA